MHPDPEVVAGAEAIVFSVLVGLVLLLLTPRRCKSVNTDGGSSRPTRCVRPAGHEGDHENDQCQGWTRGDNDPS